MHFRSKSGITAAVYVVAFVALVVIVSFAVWSVFLIRTPIILTVSNVSLSPTTIKVSENATLAFTVTNNDEAKQQNVLVTFNVSSVTFYLNNVVLPVDNNNVQFYNIVLQSSQKSTYSFKVKGVLTGGALTSTYPIRLNFYDENNTRFDTATASLTVNQ